MTFRQRLEQQAAQALDITEQILTGSGEPLPLQSRTALAMLSSQIKQQQVDNGRIGQVVSLTKLGITDKEERGTITRAALRNLLPEGIVSASGAVLAKTPEALAPNTEQGSASSEGVG